MNDEMFKSLSNMLGNSSSSGDFKNIISNFTSNSNNNNNNSNDNSTANNSSNNNFDFSNIDMETIMKIKNIMGAMNSKKDDPRSNLLLSLKPYLKPSRKEKLDQYMKFMNLATMLDTFNTMGGENIK